jgi:CRP-like cAMP-binding protein
VIAGLIRVYMTSPDGRQITVRYAHTGDLLGIAAIAGGPAPINVQILTDTALLMLNARTLQACGQTEPMVGWLLAQEATRRLYDVLEVLAGNGTKVTKSTITDLDLLCWSLARFAGMLHTWIWDKVRGGHALTESTAAPPTK